jgi:hypothetical protein
MKNVQIIDGAMNGVYDVFAVSDRDFRKLFPGDTDVAFIDEVFSRLGARRSGEILGRASKRRREKRTIVGLLGTLFYQLEKKKQFYRTRRDEEAANPDGSRLRA